MLKKPGLSAEAQQFLQSYESHDEPTDFTNIVEIRAAAKEDFSAAAHRAIKQHKLHIEELIIEGIEVQRITSQSGKPILGTLVYYFGGGFIVGCPESDLPIIGALANWCQLEVFAPQYRLAPEHPAPAAADDCMAIWQAIAQQTTGPLFLGGESAGGNLALAVAQQAQALPIRQPDAMVLLSPAVDLRTDIALYEPTTYADPTLSYLHICEVAQVYAQQADLTDPSISPLFGTMQGLPPTFITTGTRDMLLAMCLRLYRQMIRAGVVAECRVWDGLWHVFEYYDDYPEAAESLNEIASFLNQQMAAID